MLKLEDLKVGEHCTGILYDNLDTPQITGTYTIDEKYGPILKVIYAGNNFHPDDAWNRFESWEEPENVPKTLAFLCTEGIATFHDSVLIRKKHNFAGVTEITMRPTTVVFGDSADSVTDGLKVATLKSRISGLHLWLGQDAIERTVKYSEDSRSNSISLSGKSVEPICFDLGDLSVELSSPWTSTQHGTVQSIIASGQIATRCSSPITVGEHLAVHRRLQALLSLSSGNPVNFHRHYAQLEPDSEAARIFHFSTYDEHLSIDDDQTKEWSYLARYSNAESNRLKAWLDGSEIWNERSLPLTKLLQRESFWAEDRVIYAGITAENLGKKLPVADDEAQTHMSGGRKTHATWVYRCLKYSCVEHEELPFSILDLARAIANNYNKTKHFADDKTPEISVSGILGRFFVIVLRQVLIRLATNDDTTTSPLFAWDRERMYSIQSLQNIGIDENGWPSYRVVTEAKNEEESESTAAEEGEPKIGDE